jgi:8-oxo-dGTP diphosphatase
MEAGVAFGRARQPGNVVTKILAAGGVVTRRAADGELDVLVIHRPKYDDWSLPKGKVEDEDANLEATAQREIVEEAGFHCVLGPLAGMVAYVDHQGRDKTVTYWVARPVAGEFVPTDEVDEARWLTVDDAVTLLTRADDKRLVKAAAELMASTTFVFLVRHAKAGDRRRWEGDDRRRPLDDDGRRQAEALTALARGGVTRLLSSPYARCRQTLEPLAQASGLRIENAAALAEGADPELAVRVLAQAGDGTDACTHGDVLEGVLEILEEEGTFLPDHRKGAKGSTWVLSGQRGQVVAATYLPPP